MAENQLLQQGNGEAEEGTLKEGMVPGARDSSNGDDESVSSGVPELKSNVSSAGDDDAASKEKNKEVEEVKKIIQQETRFVLAMRIVVIFAMLIVSASVTYATYVFLDNEEHDEFESSYEQFAATVIESARFSSEAIRNSCNDFGDFITASALQENAKWPFFTLSHLDVHGANLRKQTGAVGFWTIHVVDTDAEKANWTMFTITTASKWYGSNQFIPMIHYFQDGNMIHQYSRESGYLPVWQLDPYPAYPLSSLDLKLSERVVGNLDKADTLKEGLVADFFPGEQVRPLWPEIVNRTTAPGEPYSAYYQPIFDSFDEENRKLVSLVSIFLPWGSYFANRLPSSVIGLHLVLENTCNASVTWELKGNTSIYLGNGDLHDRNYDRYRVSSSFNTYSDIDLAEEIGVCLYTINVYPTEAFEDEYKSNTPVISTVIVGAVFLSIVAAFLAYDTFQRKRNTKVIANAAKSNALVMSLFPQTLRDRLLGSGDNDKAKSKSTSTGLNKRGGGTFLVGNKGQLKNFLDGVDDENGGSSFGGGVTGTKSIADIFLETTILFADIVGFTAWSSMREPEQVFTLLETLFSALDKCAKRRGVYKVETVGDCYVAVTGLPEPRKDHAVAMAKFASDTLLTCQEIVKRLELTLGPDTGELGIRIGIHSGPVTAGVLRGDRARFQLFGDTMNTTARIETTGQRNRIHLSKETADLLVAAGKGHWIQARQELVTAKGKGTLQTYWLVKNGGAMSAGSSSQKTDEETTSSRIKQNLWADVHVADSKVNRLINWQVDLLLGVLKQVVARRRVTTAGSDHALSNRSQQQPFEWKQAPGQTCLDEVKEIIRLPEFDSRAVVGKLNEADTVDLGAEVAKQLRNYIKTVAEMYRANDFHNFEHACHVTMSVKKLLSRIVMPSDIAQDTVEEEDMGNNSTHSGRQLYGKIQSTLHDHTYGITSDPLTQFALVFSALIHDVDHTGVPNTTLIKENSTMATLYRNKSVAEQHSIDLAWDLLQQPAFKDLRACIYATQAEFERFRQLVVQTVLATDIVDKELKELRNARWDSAFAEREREENPRDTVNRKATIVIEHLIQASDVAHTMQHWHIYRKWNENFFRECYQAFKAGRAEQNPASYWYKGELGFFDFYIIPLAKKLKKCGVFGVASDEYLNYAMRNRQEWEDRGREVVEEMLASIVPTNDTEQTQEDGSDEENMLPQSGELSNKDSSPSPPQEVFQDEVEK